MAHKSKTQRQKAAVAKANKKDRQMREEAAAVNDTSKDTEDVKLTRAEKKEAAKKQQSSAPAKKEAKPKKVRFQFLRDVRAELKRVTWPTRTDVIRWSGVVVGALVFFGVYVAVLDNLIVTPALLALTSLGA